MSYNWNVYKIFKNGKRAKAPMTVFECEERELSDFFQNQFKTSLKAAGDNYKIIRADLPQDREVEIVDKEKQLRERKKIQALARLVRQTNIQVPKGRTLGTALIYSAKTNWNWQWAAIEKGTSNYIQGLSPTFDTHKEAQAWIENQISLET